MVFSQHIVLVYSTAHDIADVELYVKNWLFQQLTKSCITHTVTAQVLSMCDTRSFTCIGIITA